MHMNCEWCGTTFQENERMSKLILACVRVGVCYECALEWVCEPWLTLDLDNLDEE